MTRVLLSTYGSRGDVEPFLALGLGLAAAGCEVALSTADRFGDWIQAEASAASRFSFLPLTSAVIDLIETPAGKVLLEGFGGLRSLRAAFELNRLAKPLNERLMDEQLAAAEAFSPDLVVYHSKAFALPHFAEARGIPALLGLLQPMIVPTRAFPLMGLPRLPLPGFNRLSYRAAELAFGAYKAPTNRARERLGLPRVRRAREVLCPSGAGTIPVLHAFSSAVVPRPPDWPEHVHVTGYWRLRAPDYEPPAPLREFLAAGPPPVYVGFGSMPSADPAALTALVLEALERADARALISGGWGALAAQASERVLPLGPTPHDWLFPRCAAVVHHGGAGTTAAGLHAGVPSVVCPFMGDQPYWAQRCLDLGVGAPPVPRKRLSAERLGESLRVALSDQALRERARALAATLAQEDGVARGAERVLQASGGAGRGSLPS